MKLSIIIPVYNEVKTLFTLLDQIEAVRLPGDLAKEIIIVDDSSTDGTREKLEAFHKPDHIKIFYQPHNQGKTAAVVVGIKEAAGDIILFQDADLEYTPDHYPSLVQPILDGQADIVYGSRFDGSIKDMKFINWFANRTSYWTLKLLYGTTVSDFHCGFKLFKSDVIKNIPIKSHRFSFDTEITVKAIKKGYKIHDVPIRYTARSREEGKKITWGTALQAYGVMFKEKFSK